MGDGPDVDSDHSRLPDLHRRHLLGLGGLGLAGLGLAGSAAWNVGRAAADVEVVGPDTRPETTDEAIDAYVRGCTDFGLDLLAALAAVDGPDRNLMLSPLGLSSALAMAWAGTRGETERRMAETLRFPHGQSRLHPAVGALQYDLDGRGPEDGDSGILGFGNDDQFELGLVNAFWGQAGFPFRESYLDTLSRNYGSDLREVDFDAGTADATRRINTWAQEASGGRVEELVPPDAIDHRTVAVLATVVALHADWQQPFEPSDTRQKAFTRPDGSTVEVPMMHGKGQFPSLGVWTDEPQSSDAGNSEAENGEVDSSDRESGVGYRMVELPYVGGEVSMVLVVPSRDRSLADLEAAVDAAWLAARFADLDDQREGGPVAVRVRLPRFTFGTDLELTDQLEALGMTTAFDAARADFTGMTDSPTVAEQLRLDWVFHDTHVAVDEAGTGAVAASAAGVERVSLPPVITFDRPFLFCIRDRPTDAVLFLGRVVDPSAD